MSPPLSLDIASQATVPLVFPADHLRLPVHDVAHSVVSLAMACHDEVATAQTDLGTLALQVLAGHPQVGLAASRAVRGTTRVGADDVDGELDPVVHSLPRQNLSLDSWNTEIQSIMIIDGVTILEHETLAET